MSKFYKVVRPDLASFHDASFKYRIGHVRRAPAAEDRQICGPGLLHASPLPEQAAGYGRWPYRLLLVEGDPVVTRHDKAGFLRLKVLEELPVYLAWGPAGQIVERVVRRAERLTIEEAKSLGAAWGAAWGAALGAARDAARGAALASSVSDLVGQHGLTQAHLDTLLQPWRYALGHDPLTDDEVWPHV